MEHEGWLQIGIVLLLLIGTYLLIRRPLQRKRLFDLAEGGARRRRQARSAKKLLSHHCR